MLTAISQSKAQIQESSSLDTLTLNGIFRGENIKMKNPYLGSDTFSIKKIILNDSILVQDFYATGIQIDLIGLGLKEGEDFKIEFIHIREYKPIILNAKEFK